MDRERVSMVRQMLLSTGWVDRTRGFAGSLRRSTKDPGGLLLVGTPDEEPWHLAAHLDDESRLSGIAEIAPTLVRWQVPDGAPPHLSFTLERLEAARRGESLLVVSETDAPEKLLDRVSDARRKGATVFAIDGGDAELEGLAHESLTVVRADLTIPELSFETVQHLVSAAAGEPDDAARTDPAASGRRGVRSRLGRALDAISGSSPNDETRWR